MIDKKIQENFQDLNYQTIIIKSIIFSLFFLAISGLMIYQLYIVICIFFLDNRGLRLHPLFFLHLQYNAASCKRQHFTQNNGPIDDGLREQFSQVHREFDFEENHILFPPPCNSGGKEFPTVEENRNGQLYGKYGVFG
jgi:hypothetical protein